MATPTTTERPRPRTVTAAGTEPDNSRIGKLRANIQNVLAELRKVNWPTREETRNLTIVVIGISAVIGSLLGVFDFALSALYTLLKGTGG